MVGVVLGAPLLFGACAVGNKHAYHSVVASVPSSGADQIAVATHDQRPYIISGNKAPQFVGLSRGGYGNPFDVTTEDGRSLAEDMTQAIVNSLNQKGYHSVPVVVTAADGAAVAREKLVQVDAERAVLLTLREWKSDTYVSTTITYDVTLTVLSRAGEVIGESRLQGEDNLGKDVINPPALAKKVTPAAFKAKLEQLFSEPTIVAALQGSP
jgi:hypothetical protein